MGARASGFATARDGVRLYFEDVGSGPPLLFIHEFAGDHRSWRAQVAHFSAEYRCITYGARGYPPSDVPEDPAAYSQDRAVVDAIAVLDHLQIRDAHIVGLSMGGFCALHVGLQHPHRARSLVVAGCGYGARPERRAVFQAECDAIARAFETEGGGDVAKRYAVGPARVQFQNKNPAGWREFAEMLAEHSSVGAALTMRGVQRERPSLYDMRDRLIALNVPTLIVAGDEDEECLEPSLMLKRSILFSGLAIMPRTGHTCNLEDPPVFNGLVQRFLALVEADEWGVRDPRSLSGSITGMAEVQLATET
jgi:pimeloyl-ACP methyl ester carboxylesterase